MVDSQISAEIPEHEISEANSCNARRTFVLGLRSVISFLLGICCLTAQEGHTSYDLHFAVPEDQAPPNIEALEKYFTDRPGYTVEKNQAWYNNEDTGIYFGFYFSDPTDNEQDPEFLDQFKGTGLKPAGCDFNINYLRPHIFGLAAEPELSAFIDHFRFRFLDPQTKGMGTGKYSREGFLKGWNSGNRMAYQVASQDPDLVREDASSQPLTLPEKELERIWQWNQNRQTLQDKLGDQIFVPRIFFFQEAGQVQSLCVWGDGIPIALPTVDVVMLIRKSLAPRTWIGLKKSDFALVLFETLFQNLVGKGKVADAAGYTLFQDDPPAESTVRFFKDQPAHTGETRGVTVDKILTRELAIQVGLIDSHR